MKIQSIILVLITLSIFTKCSSEHGDNEIKTTKIKNLKEHADTVIIGTQIWTTKNLNVSTFQNGDTIFEAKSINEFEDAGNKKKPAWCYYNSDTSYKIEYGKLYNWYAVNDPRGLAPKGWHIPTINDWDTLTKFLGGEDVCGIALRYTSGWPEGLNGNNKSGFCAIPGGEYMFNEFSSIKELGYWWASNRGGTGAGYARYLNFNYESLQFAGFSSSAGFSVRCIKN
jgi:uncharacterized protein (TIGR02145 family)